MTYKDDSRGGTRGPGSRGGEGRGEDRPRRRQGEGRDRQDSRDRRSPRGGGPRRGFERRPAGPPTPEDEKWMQVSEEEIRGQMRQLIAGSNLLETGFGARRFHFITRRGRIPFLDVSDDLSFRLTNGLAAIVELPGEGPEEYSVVPRGLAIRLKAVDAQMVRFFCEND